MNEKAMNVYRDLLVEIKFRTEALDKILFGGGFIRAQIDEEICYLQLRLICEIVAIGTLVVNGEIASKKTDLFKSYKADWIIKEFSKLHPQFYPIPLENEDTNENPPGWIYKTDGFMTQQELAKLWSESASLLHRGTAKAVTNSKQLPLNSIKVVNYRNKIVNLLNRHIIRSPDNRHICYFIMNDGNNNVHSALLERVKDM